MTTLFQLHADINTLKTITQDMATYWQAGDSILLLGTTAAYIDWFQAYIKEINEDEERAGSILDIQTLYVLQTDVESINNTAMAYLNFDNQNALTVKQITDSEWVALTQMVDKVVTLQTNQTP